MSSNLDNLNPVDRSHQRAFDPVNVGRLTFRILDDADTLTMVDKIGDVIANVNAIHAKGETLLQLQVGDFTNSEFDFQLDVTSRLALACKPNSVYRRSHIAPLARRFLEFS